MVLYKLIIQTQYFNLCWQPTTDSYLHCMLWIRCYRWQPTTDSYHHGMLGIRCYRWQPATDSYLHGMLGIRCYVGSPPLIATFMACWGLGAKCAIVQQYHGMNKYHFDEMMLMMINSALQRLTCLVGVLLCQLTETTVRMYTCHSTRTH